MAETVSPARPYAGILAAAVVAGLAFFAMSRSSEQESMVPRGAELDALVQEAVTWIQEERDRQRPEARGLTEWERDRMAPFFPAEILDAVRIRFVPRFQNPPFLTALAKPGEALAVDFRNANAMAIDDTVLALEHLFEPEEEPWLTLLFHELVHVVQYRTLGIEGFVRSYIQALEDADFRYRRIRHEAQAFELQERFEANPDEGFSVADEVEELLGG